jgi:hypothetical protein
MNYVYNDEDNNPMNDPVENLHHVTGYLSFEEMRAVESGEYFAHLEERKEAEQQKRKDNLDGLLDLLQLTGKCRECPNVCELGEGFLDKNGLISNEQVEYLEHICKVCGGKGTGIIPEKAEAHLDKEWADRLEWAKSVFPRYSCAWCPTAFRIYGQYKDPDDEWNAIDSPDGCANCKYFQED